MTAGVKDRSAGALPLPHPDKQIPTAIKIGISNEFIFVSIPRFSDKATWHDYRSKRETFLGRTTFASR